MRNLLIKKIIKIITLNLVRNRRGDVCLKDSWLLKLEIMHHDFTVSLKSRVVVVFFVVSFFITANLFCQENLSWKTLSNINFVEKYDESTNAYWLMPIFSQQIKNYDKKTVVVSGYFIPVDQQSNFYVLSRYPYSSCFFCGGAGPESVIELQFADKPSRNLIMDKQMTFKGKFSLNETDFNHCNYILKEATIHQ